MQSTPRRTQGLRSGERGARILEAVQSAVTAEFTDRGFVDFSVDRVAKAAGVNRTTIYRRWATKAELLRFVLHPLLARYNAPTITDSPRADLVALLKLIRDASDLPLGRAFTEATYAAQDELRELTAEVTAAAMSPFFAVMQRAATAGQIRANEVDTRTHLAFFGIVMWGQTHKDPASDDECAALAHILLP